MKWAYIYEHPGTDPVRDRTVVERDGVTSLMVPVPDAGVAPGVAQHLVAEGVRLVELCGGFASEAVVAVTQAVGDQVAVGHVTFSMESLAAAARYSSDFEAELGG